MTVERDVDAQARQLLPEGQEDILAHIQNLADAEALKLVSQLKTIDWNSFLKVAQKPDVSALSAPNVLSLSERESCENRVRSAGAELIKAGKVANLIVAGGQGSRLGFEGPKGCFMLDAIGKSIFQIHAERQRALQAAYNTAVPLLIMTGQHNTQETRDYFEANDFFGLHQDSVHFFEQGSIPTFSADRKLQLASSDTLLQNPNGHGGTVEALIQSGLLRELQQKGVEYINYIQVDNILARLDDTFAIGLAHENSADVVTKVVEKATPDEKVGCLVQSAGFDQIVEYSDVTPDQTRMTDSEGNLVLRWGNTAMHILSVPFLARFETELSLPFHISAPKNATIYQSGQLVSSEVVKYERFIFDLLLETKKSIGLAVDRSLEFAPIKNATGTDSPETALALFTAAGGSATLQ